MSGDKARVLVVEGSDDIRNLEREVVRQAFKSGVVEIVESRSAKTALEKFSSEPFHLLLLDVSPYQPSDAVRDLIRESRARQRCPAIAFSTGRIDQETLKMLAADHCFAIFPKPFDPKDVQSTIHEALEAHSRSTDALVSPVLHGIMRMLHGASEK